MGLDPLVLDDLDWAQLTDAARQRLPALSGGRWTLHAPVDPGITLVELYAWLLDQRVYWMDRVDEPLFRAAIDLLGERMRPVRPARTVVALQRSGPLTRVAAGTTLELARAEVGPVFATTHRFELLNVERIGLIVSGAGDGAPVDRSHDLREERGVVLFNGGGRAGEAKIFLHMPTGSPASTSRWFSLYFDVEAPPRVLPEWHPESIAVAPPAELTWWYSRGPTLPPKRFPDSSVRDGTSGFRRAGLLRLRIPADWGPEGPATGSQLPFAILARTHAGHFTFPVRVRRIVPNATIVEHRRIVRERHRLMDWLPLPGRSITLKETSAPPIPEETRVGIREIDGRWHRWRVVSDFARSGPGDRVFRVDRVRRRIEFGDGLTGRIPRLDLGVAPNESNVRIIVRVGAGAAGNVGARLDLTGDVMADVRGITLVEATGGAEAETIDQARVRISGLLDRVERAVTSDDHVALALNTPGVAIARAHAAVGFHPLHPCTPVPGAITVFVVPWAPRGDGLDAGTWVGAPMPDPGALAAVRGHLDRTRMVGTEVWVCPPRYRTVRLSVRVLGDPVDHKTVRQNVDFALRRFLDPLRGGDDQGGWRFGDPIRPSVLMREAVPVVEDAEIESVSIGLDGAAPSEDCKEVQLGPHVLPALVEVAVHFDRDHRNRPGGLR